MSGNNTKSAPSFSLSYCRWSLRCSEWVIDLLWCAENAPIDQECICRLHFVLVVDTRLYDQHLVIIICFDIYKFLIILYILSIVYSRVWTLYNHREFLVETLSIPSHDPNFTSSHLQQQVRVASHIRLRETVGLKRRSFDCIIL